MDVTENKQLLEHFIAELAKGNFQPFVDSLADDVRWTIMGTRKWCKTYEGKKAVLTHLFEPFIAQFPDSIRVTPHRVIAEGEYTVVEGRGQATTKGGKAYNNTYCWIYRIVGGKAREVTEYADTALVDEVVDTGMWSAAG